MGTGENSAAKKPMMKHKERIRPAADDHQGIYLNE
jgi:hypothetical protein